MAILPVLTYPDPKLRTKAKPVKLFDQSLTKLIADMTETMYQEEGIGLAATQIDQHIQLIVIDVSEEYNSPQVIINPKIISSSGETGIEEGCLSVPEYKAWVPRFATIVVEAVDQDNKPLIIEADGLLAICLQHEIDHLQGKLFVDYLSPLKRTRLKKKLEKQLRDD